MARIERLRAPALFRPWDARGIGDGLTDPRSERDLSTEERETRRAILTQPEPSKAPPTSDAVVLKRRELFLLCEPSGDVPLEPGHALGLYLEDRRYLSGYALSIEGARLALLGFSSARAAETRHELIDRAVGAIGGSGDLAVSRRRHVDDETLSELLVVRNYGVDKREVRLRIDFTPGFEDIFVLKGFSDLVGSVGEPLVRASAVEIPYTGIDGETCAVTLSFAPAPDELDRAHAAYRIALGPREEASIGVRIVPRPGTRRDPAQAEPRFDIGTTRAVFANTHEDADEGPDFVEIRTSNELLDAALDRSFADLRLLRSRLHELDFYEAGVPWFATLFGRDAAITSLQLLAYDRIVARDTLRLLARYQATAIDVYRDAEPGKIVHELRSGELARAGVIPQSPAYYGTIDATLLFLILAVELFAWSADLDFVRELEPSLRAALDWSTDVADHDGDGLLDYTGAPTGLVHQGWKDSGNAIVDEHGAVVGPAVALCEVQAYAFRAWLGMAPLLRALGDADRALDLERRAARLRDLVERAMWWEAEGVHLLALHGRGEPARVVSSNAGQVLWGGITSAERAARVAARLFEQDMWSGWGIRTLSSRARAYHPTSYHRGSVWPHDNALILAGFRRYGLDAAAQRVFGALLDAATGFRDMRLPELWSGHEREPGEARPVGYPVASSPQAWAAGALPHAIVELLGLEADLAGRRLIVRRPVLPLGVTHVELRGVRLGGARVDVRVERRDAGVAVEWGTSDAAVRVERVDALR